MRVVCLAVPVITSLIACSTSVRVDEAEWRIRRDDDRLLAAASPAAVPVSSPMTADILLPASVNGSAPAAAAKASAESKALSSVLSGAPAPAAAVSGNATDIKQKLVYNIPVKNFTAETLGKKVISAANVGFADLDCIKRDNIVTVDEAATWGSMNGVPWYEIKPIFKALDKDHDNQISKEEFEKALPTSENMIKEFRAGFKDIDLNGDSQIDDKEWQAYCAGWMTPKPNATVCTKLFVSADTKGPKGTIGIAEFNLEKDEANATKDEADKTKAGEESLLQSNANFLRGSERAQPSILVVDIYGRRNTATELLGELRRRHMPGFPSI